VSDSWMGDNVVWNTIVFSLKTMTWRLPIRSRELKVGGDHHLTVGLLFFMFRSSRMMCSSELPRSWFRNVRWSS
jgi:hypothetical protein